jgi:hypothetical protein
VRRHRTTFRARRHQPQGPSGQFAPSLAPIAEDVLPRDNRFGVPSSLLSRSSPHIVVWRADDPGGEWPRVRSVGPTPKPIGYFAGSTATCFSTGSAAVTGTDTVRMPLS